MRMNEPSRWQMPGGPLVFSGMVADGNAVALTNAAPKWMWGRPVAVEAGMYDRFVAWDAEALRKHGLHLEEAARLEHLFEACGTAAFGAGGCFICKAVDARGYHSLCVRQVLMMTNYGRSSEPFWLIHV